MNNIHEHFMNNSSNFRRGLDYICLHESGLSSFHFSFSIRNEMSILIHVNLGLKLGMKSTFIMAEMKIFSQNRKFYSHT